MKRLTLLEIVQNILSEMVSDAVNSIDDTEEATTVAEYVRITYFDILSRDDWKFLQKLTTLDSYGDPDYPNYMRSPVEVSKIKNIRYNVTTVDDDNDIIRVISYLEPEDFLDKLYARNTSDSNIEQIVDPSGVTLFVMNDKMPEWYTSFDDSVLVFDSYDSAEDTTLQATKSMAFVIETPEWTHEDSFIPTLPADMFSLLLEESTIMAFQNLRQINPPLHNKRAYRAAGHARHASKRVKDRQPRKGFGR